MNQQDLISRVLSSYFFKKATKKAGKYGVGSVALLELLREVLVKAKHVGDKEGKSMGTVVLDRFNTLGRLVKAYVSGTYRVIPWPTILKIVAVFIYFISPIDVIPDFLPIIGLSDDIALLGWLFNSLASDIEAFEAWEQSGVIKLG